MLREYEGITGGLHSRVCNLGVNTLRVWSLGLPVLDRATKTPVLKKNYKGSFNVNAVWGV